MIHLVVGYDLDFEFTIKAFRNINDAQDYIDYIKMENKQFVNGNDIVDNELLNQIIPMLIYGYADFWTDYKIVSMELV